MFRSRSPWQAAVAALVLSSPTLCARDVKSAEQAIRLARWAVESKQFTQADQRLGEATAALDGIAAADAERLRGEIAAVRSERDAVEAELQRQPLFGELQRGLDSAQRALDDGTTGDGDAEVAATMEYPLARLLQRLDDEHCQRWLTQAERDDFKHRAADLRRQGEAAGRDIRVRRAERWIGKAEAVCRGEETTQYRDTVLQWFEHAAGEIGQIGDDTRAPALNQRLAKARSDFDRMTASDDREARITELTERWASIESTYAGDSIGWENEPAPTYEAWRNSGTLNMPLLEARHSLLIRMSDDDDYRAARSELADDPRIRDLVGTVDGQADAVARKIGAIVEQLAARAEQDASADRDELASRLQWLGSVVERLAGGTPTGATAATRLTGVIGQLNAAQSAAAAAHQQAIERGLAQAEQRWPQLAAAFGEALTTIDPVASVEQPGEWRGKQVRLEGYSNRAGWDFSHADYDFIVQIQGSPVAGRLDPALRTAIAAAERANGLRFATGDISALVGVVDSIGRVQGIQYSQVLQQHLPTYDSKAPVLRIVAVRAGPFALSIHDPQDAGTATGGSATGSAASGDAATGTSGSAGFPWLLILASLGIGGFVARSRNPAVIRLRTQILHHAASALRTLARRVVTLRRPPAKGTDDDTAQRSGDAAWPPVR